MCVFGASNMLSKYMKSVTTRLLILFVLAFFSLETAYGQSGDERSRAIALFHDKEYAEALIVFQKLEELSPVDALLKYFIGASMMETGTFSGETEIYLLLAGSEDVPAKVFYYLGNFYHHKEDWDNAIRYYNRFRNNSSVEEIQGVGLNLRIEEVYAQKKPGAFTTPLQLEAETVDAQHNEQSQTLLPPDGLLEASTTSLEVPYTDSSDAFEIVHPNLIPSIQFQINAQVTYWLASQFKIDEARQAWERGKEKETELTMLSDSLHRLRVEYHAAGSVLVRNQLANIIVPMERATLITKAEAEKYFSQARAIESSWWNSSNLEAVASLQAENLAFQQANDSIIQQALQQAYPTIEDETYENQEMHAEDASGEEEDIVYKVQLGSFSGRVPVRTQTVFDQMARVRPIETFLNENNSTVYTTGNLRNFDDALSLQNQIRIEGIKDAFVIAIKDGKRISLPEAKNITDEE